MEHWNEALRRIEDNLDREIDVAALARVAQTSEYHFRRMFSTLSGLPLSEYVRRRRLTQATAEILDGDAGVLEVAVKYGYGSADAFTRAFKAMHGMTPSQARRPGAVLRSQSRMSFHLTIKGHSKMQHRLTELDGFRVTGRMTRIPIVYEGPNTAIADFTASLPDDLNDRLLALADVEALPGLLFATANQERDGPNDIGATTTTRSPPRPVPTRSQPTSPYSRSSRRPGSHFAARARSHTRCRTCGPSRSASGSRRTPTACCPAHRCSRSSTPATTAPAGAANCGCRSSARTEHRVAARGRRGVARQRDASCFRCMEFVSAKPLSVTMISPPVSSAPARARSSTAAAT